MLIDSVDEFDSPYEVRDVVMSAKFSPSLGGTLGRLEHHGQAGFGTAATFRLSMSQADRGERAFDRVCGANVTPVLGWKIEERQQDIPILDQALHRTFILGIESLFEQIHRVLRVVFWGPLTAVLVCVVDEGFPD
jgi:hypothetical protein